MDSTLVGAIAGILGGIIGSVVTGFFTLRAAKQQAEAVIAQSQGNLNERLYNQNLDLNRFFAEFPEIRPFFMENKELREAKTSKDKWRVEAVAEMIAGFIELIALQMDEIPEPIQLKWKNYITDAYNSSAVLRAHFDECSNWYVEEVLLLLPQHSNTQISQSHIEEKNPNIISLA